MNELVVLVDEQNKVLGTMPKDEVHTHATPLHRGFSLFIFNSKNELLVTKRALSKKTFPGVWSNTVCGHPAPDEDPVDAAKRRLKDELGMVAERVRIVAPYRYSFADVNGIRENEICPILVGFSDFPPQPNAAEVGEWKWMSWETFLTDLELHPDMYSPWSREEASIVENLHVITN